MSRSARGTKAYQDGQFAERLAAVLLRLKGYRIVATRYRTPVGEIDIIAVKGTVLAFVEVKSRADRAVALGAISAKSQGRIRRAAEWYGQRQPVEHLTQRFDVVLIGGGWWPLHLKNAFGHM